MSDRPLFTIVFGPTASGKSAYAYELAQKQQGNVLSFDSRHVYTYMDIVTGKDKPGKDFSQSVFGQDLVEPDQEFSIRHYYEYALPIISDHRLSQQPLILVGGSWLYAQVLINPPASLFVPQNKELREQAQSLSVEQLQDLLQQSDPQKFSTLNTSDRNNPRRLIRAIEVVQASSAAPVQNILAENEFDLMILNPDFDQVTKRIQKRVIDRVKHGALEETAFLKDKYSDWNTPAFSATGYGYLRDFLENRIPLEIATLKWSQQERDYAKRQVTWINKILSTRKAKTIQPT